MSKRLFLFFAMLVAFSTSIMAQVTTSSINGRITAGGEEIIGATVVATHQPSGTRYNAVTNDKGRYAIQGMRVGGPYEVKISYIGYKDEVIKNVYISLGEPSVFNVDMKEDAKQLGEVTITGKAKANIGAAQNFSRNQIENAPTVSRNIYDVATLSPLVTNNKFGGITIAGTNNRYNSFQIDGMVSNDVFGLASSGTNGGQTGTNPISMDAIQEIQVVASPFDVRQSGFTGGAINAITKSGTNEFKGTAFGYYTDENMYGRWNQARDMKQKLTDETTKTAGFTFGGPIIKDKLFFFTSFEYKKNSYPSSYFPSDSYFLSPELAQQIADRYERYTGHKEAFTQRNINTQGISVLGRLDWNINNNNKLSFRYQLNDSYKDVYGSGNYTYYFNNSTYRMNNKTNSFVAELNSHINNNLYNELRAGVTFVRDNREIPYAGPNIYINTSKKVNLGTEYSSGANYLNQDIWTVEDNLSIYAGNHTVTVGTHNEIYKMKNMFIQAAYGEYVYSSIDDFLNDRAGSFVYNYSDEAITGSKQYAPDFKAGQFGVYVQDKWDPTTRFQLTYGIRLDVPVYFNSPSVNEKFNTSKYTYPGGPMVGQKPYSYVMCSPRLGFRWYVTPDHRTTLRGGVGIFNGRAPFVWMANAWNNTGVEQKGVTIYNTDENIISFEKYGSNVDKLVADNATKGKGANPVINTIDRRFKLPQVFRANLALEQMLPGDIKMTIEGLYSKGINNVWFENLCLHENGKVYAVSADYPNSGTTYFKSDNNPFSKIIHTTNTNKGYSYSASVKLEKSFNFGLDLMATYTFGHSFSVNDGTSSVAASSWNYNYSVDPTKQTLSHTLFDKPHRIVAMVSYNSKRYGARRWQTHVGLTYNGFSGQRYSLTMADNASASFNGEYTKGNSLLYIPTDEELSKMTFMVENGKNAKGYTQYKVDETGEQAAKYKAWIESDSYAKNHRGQYADRNSNLAHWENHFDLHLAQDFYYLREKGSKIELTFDVLNVANMINKKWGTTYSNAYNCDILTVVDTKKDSNGNMFGRYTFSGNGVNKSDVSSRWHAQLGLRVTF